MRVQQLMSKSVHWCRPDDTLDRAARLMWDGDCGVLPVCVSNGTTQVIGIVTDRDLCMSALFHGRALHEIRVEDAMSRELHTCGPDDSTATAERAMQSAQVRRLPVVAQSGELVGMISLADIAREARREATQSSRAGALALEISESEVGDTLAAIVTPQRRALHREQKKR